MLLSDAGGEMGDGVVCVLEAELELVFYLCGGVAVVGKVHAE